MQELNWKEVAVRLKGLRNGNKLTIERLSELVGVSPSFIGLIERGETGVSIENLYKLSQVFNCSLDYLITGNESANILDTYSRFTALNAALYDYSDNEIDFIIEMSKFLKSKVNIKE